MRGKEVAAVYTMRPEERQGGAPPHWNMERQRWQR